MLLHGELVWRLRKTDGQRNCTLKIIRYVLPFQVILIYILHALYCCHDPYKYHGRFYECAIITSGNWNFRTKKTKNLASPTGNRTRVSHVTGEDTHHYTIEDADLIVSDTRYDVRAGSLPCL